MQCTQCGHALSAAELAGVDCPYCGTVLPHRARAAEKAAVVEQILADRDGNGVPDIFEAGMRGVPGAPGGFPGAFTSHQVHTSNVVIVNGAVQPDGKLPDHVARQLAAAGIVLPQAGPPTAAPAPSPPSNARMVALAAGGIVSLALVVLLLFLSRG